MHIIQAVRQFLAKALRVIHITLWMTIPTAVWLWLFSEETPSDCVPTFAGYEGNALCISDFAFLLIVLGQFLLGSFAGACWIGGYFVEVVFRAIRGDSKLPPVQLGFIGVGWGLVKSSLRYWLPFIAVFLAAHAIRAKAYPWDFRSPVLDTLPLIAALVVFWGYLVGLARGVAYGERSLIWRRRENIRMALANFEKTLALTLVLIALPLLGAFSWSKLSELLTGSDEMDLMVEAALGSFGFYMLLMACGVTCSYLIARYARAIGLGDHLNPSSALDKQ